MTLTMNTIDEIVNCFSYHSPARSSDPKAITAAHENLREAGKRLALQIFELCPKSAERTIALRRIQEAVMYGNAAIALDHEATIQALRSKDFD